MKGYKSETDIDWSKSNADLCSYFTEPKGWEYVLKDFPSLRVCLAHFGRESEFDACIREMMPKYPNLYVDISYSLFNTDHWGYMLVLLRTRPEFLERTLFGSDYYMNKIEGAEKIMSINLRAFIGEDLWKQITETNPLNFLR